MNDPVLIAVAPSIPPYMRAGLPPLDLSPEGIATEVIRAWNAGASIAHLHVWDEKGTPTQEIAAFERTVRLIREQCDMLIEGSTGGFNELTPAERSVALQADIDLASLNPGSVNYDEGVYINPPEAIAYWAQEMHVRGIKPDAAIFEAGMIANTLRLAAEGWVVAPYLFTFVLGQPGAMPATARNLCFMRDSIPQDAVWGAIGHGGHDVRIAVMALSMGGHVRAGFEDNPYYRPGEPATHNAQLIERLVRVAEELGRPVASPGEARKLLGLAGSA
jgi:3-keto-5-aminohexanoate cleavage enzyme